MRPIYAAIAGAIALVLAAAALAEGADRATTSSTIHLVQTPVSSTFVDLGAKGPSIGDLLVLRATLASPATGKTVGHADGYCVLLDPAQQEYQCQILNVLAGGTLVGTGPFTPGKVGVAALSGTGAYAGVRGEVTITPKGTKGVEDLVFAI